MMKYVFLATCLAVSMATVSAISCHEGTDVLGISWSSSTSFDCDSCYRYEIIAGTTNYGCQYTTCSDDTSSYLGFTGYSCCNTDLCNSAVRVMSWFNTFMMSAVTIYFIV
ncbi:hypothetical protein LSH36_215g00008 [Paralvinella palmiformis]|uniref:Uncharacterized protein n=1 Tax=Paralvinella palmiformis TaxID=53620 RepID=A0AAD9JPR6_9ANNE|nr:hypothetical protein LSH36_215g00008 [Paralvinella palmiformis]